MKMSSLVIIFALIGTSPVLAGGRNSGGGFYGKDKSGNWILLDDLEEGVPLDVNVDPFKSQVEKVTQKIREIAKSAPEFAKELNLPLQKKWHLVDFEITCEDPASILNIKTSAGACQNDNDVFVEKSKYEAEASPEKLIMHELVQGVRLSKNKTAQYERVSRADVRAISTAIKNGLYRDETKFVEELAKYSFGEYETSTEFKARQELENRRSSKFVQMEQQEDAILNASSEVCRRNLSIRNEQDRTNALNAISKAQLLITDLLNKLELLKRDQDFYLSGEAGEEFLYFFSSMSTRLKIGKAECGQKQKEVEQVQYR